jgi:hypothetical protein
MGTPKRRMPRGLEAVIAKAGVSPEFADRLVNSENRVFPEIEPILDLTEQAMLAAMPAEHLRRLIAAQRPREGRQGRAMTVLSVSAIAFLLFAGVWYGSEPVVLGTLGHTLIQENPLPNTGERLPAILEPKPSLSPKPVASSSQIASEPSPTSTSTDLSE